MSYQEHQKKSANSVACAIITVSDTRTETTDQSGSLIRDMLADQGHSVCGYDILRDEPARIAERLAELESEAGCQAILINGGTGIAPRDRTVEAVVKQLDRRLEGFGELFRMLSFEQIGSGAMLSRAVAGVMAGRVVFCMPGSPQAVRLAMSRLILPELGHLILELNK